MKCWPDHRSVSLSIGMLYKKSYWFLYIKEKIKFSTFHKLFSIFLCKTEKNFQHFSQTFLCFFVQNRENIFSVLHNFRKPFLCNFSHKLVLTNCIKIWYNFFDCQAVELDYYFLSIDKMHKLLYLYLCKVMKIIFSVLHKLCSSSLCMLYIDSCGFVVQDVQNRKLIFVHFSRKLVLTNCISIWYNFAASFRPVTLAL